MLGLPCSGQPMLDIVNNYTQISAILSSCSGSSLIYSCFAPVIQNLF